MAQDKRIFTGGMDKDSDPRLIKGGDYRDALNIRNISSSDSTSGSVENIEGNTLVPFNFIDETDELIIVNPVSGDEVYEEVNTNGVFQSLSIEITGREIAGLFYSFILSYVDNSDAFQFIPFSPISWSGVSSQTNASTTLYTQFGPGGIMSEIQVTDTTTGLPITLTASLDFEEDAVLNVNTFTITYTCNQAGATFSLLAESSTTNQDGIMLGLNPDDYGSESESTIGITSDGSVTIGGSINFEISDDGSAGSVDDADNVFGSGPSLNNDGTVISLEFEGTQPTDPSIQATSSLTLFSYTQSGSGNETTDFLVEPFIDLDTVAFEEGGEFEFTESQNSVAGFLTNIVTDEDKLNNILIDGGNGATTSLGSISTDFLSGTKLQGRSTGLARNNPDAPSYSQLEYYYNNTEVIEGDGFSINEGTLTFSGDTVLSQNAYPLKSSIIENKNYLLSFTVAGITDANSFTFNIGNDTSDSISKDGIHNIYMTPGTNSSIIYIRFNKDFTSSNEIVITNLRLSLEDVAVSKMTITLASSGSAKFKLAFAESDDALKLALSRGDEETEVKEWFPGIGLKLTTKNTGSGYGDVTSEDWISLTDQLTDALALIVTLTATIASTEVEHTLALATLNDQLVIAQSDAAQLQLDLDAANALNVSLNSNLSTLQGYVNDFLITQDSGFTLSDTYNNNLDGISTSLNAVNEAITSLSTSNISNTSLQEEIDLQISQINDLNIKIEELNTSITAGEVSEAETEAEIIKYSNSLNETIDLLDDLGHSLASAVSDLNISSNISQETIDNFVNGYNSSSNTLLEQLSSMNDLVAYLRDQIDLLESNSGNEENDKWLLTFNGGVPVSLGHNYLSQKTLVVKNTNNSLEDLEYTLYHGAETFTNLRDSILRDINFTTRKHPLYNFITGLNTDVGRLKYNSSLQLQSDNSEYISFPESFLVYAASLSGVGSVLKFTVYNLQSDNVLVDASGNSYTSNSTGDKIIGDKGDVPIKRDPTDWLSNKGVTTGIQIEIEALDGSSGWEFFLRDSSDSSTDFPLSNQTDHTLAKDSSIDYNWNVSRPRENDTIALGGLNYRMYFEKIGQTTDDILPRNTSGSVESFVSSAVSSDFSIDSIAPSGNLTFPSKKSDIIVNKSRDVKPNLSKHITGAKKFIKNKILNKTTVRDNSSSSYKCIGTYEDKPKNSIYYLVHHVNGTDKYDCILEYSLIDNKIRTVYQDGRQGSNGLHEGILNFDLDHAITGVSKVDDMLYWTDNLNRPRKINVNLGKNNEVNISSGIIFEDVNFPGSHSNSVFLTYNDVNLRNKYSIGDTVYTHVNAGSENTSFNGYAEVLGIVRKMPDGLTFNTTDGSNEVTSSVALIDSQLEAGEWIGIMDSTIFPRFYQVADISGTTITTVSPVTFTLTAALALYLLPSGGNIGGLLTNCPFQNFSAVSGIIMSADPSDAYSPLISFGKYEDKMRYFDVIKHQPLNRPVTVLSRDISYAKNNILDTLFQFKYRYSHKDNENTSYSGISNINIDSEFARNTPLKHSEYRETANTIEVEYFDTISDVKKIEITTRKGNDGEFTLVDTVQNNFIKYLKILKNEVIVDPDYYFEITKSIINFRNNGVYPFINKSEGDKLFDAVPKLAKAQTIISDNRLTYGNILEGYDNTPLVVSSSFNAEGPILETNESNFPVYGTSSGSNIITNQNFSFSENNFGAAGSNIALLLEGDINAGSVWNVGSTARCQLEAYLDISGIDLNLENSQNISIDISWSVQRENIFGQSKKRASRFAMNVDVTGLDSINQVRNKIIDKFNQGDWNGGTKIGSTDTSDCQKDEGGGASVSVSQSGFSKLKIRWKHKKNSDEGGNTTGTSWGIAANGWQTSIVNITAKLLSGDAGFNAFKTGAFHDFGISYFDETNRCSFVNVAPDYGQDVTLQEGYNTALISANLNGTRSYNKFPTEPNGPAIGQSSGLKLSIYNKPPSWATSYQVMYAGNTSVDEFMQVTVPHAIPGVGGDTQMYLSLQSLKSHKASYTEATGALTDFDVAKGDRIRFISCDPGSGRKKFNDYLDFEITGFEFYNEEPADVNGNPIAVGSGQEGFYIRISNPGSQAAQIDGGTVSINHSGFSLSGSGYDKLIAELYRPKKTQTPESTVYFELGDRLKIGDPGEVNNYHTGIEDQGAEYFYDKGVNTMVSLTPAVININEGDIYLKSRNMFTVTDGASLESFPCESYYLNDFHSTNHYDKGRINVVNNNAEERRLDTSVYYSEPYVSTGAINGLSSFNLANTPYFDYNKEFGSIQSLQTKDNDLIIFHESKVGRVLVGQDILNTASGEGLVSLSNNVIDNYASLYSGQFGCGLNPESIVKHGHKFYFADIKRGAILRLSTDGLTVISEYGMKDYFRDLGEMYIKHNPDKIQTFNDSSVDTKNVVPYLLVGGYDPKYNEYVITFPEIESGGRNYIAGNASTVKNWSQGILNWDDATLDPNLSSIDVIFNAVTLGFSEGTNKWTSFYSYIPDFYSKINNQFVSFKNGRVYRHNDSDLYSINNSEFNSFYGNGNLSYIDFVFNASPSSVKSYNSIGLESDTKFITGMFTNMGQYYGNYDDVTTTSIAFKRVGGLVSSTENPRMIVGNGTSFYEDLAPGDLVRVFGYAKTDYIHKDFIIDKVISNSLISVNEDLSIEFTSSYMLVIDYKSKEGIQYSSIPFVRGGLNSLDDNFQFGDGSEIQGIGVAIDKEVYLSNSGSLTSGSTSHTFEKFSANVMITPSEMIVGGSYTVSLNSGAFDVSDVDPTVSSSNVGTVFTCKTPSDVSFGAHLVPTDIKLYVKNEDNTTTFLGYPYSQDLDTDKVYFVPAPDLVTSYTPGFYFTVKSGEVEGERLKGSYMRTILATNKSQSKKKFNLYAANADVDKSELSDK